MRYLSTLVLILMFSSPSLASIPDMYQQIAKRYGVPAELFYAIVLNESKYSVDGGKTLLPWPWTLNHKKKPYFFETRLDAYLFIKGLVDEGHTNFDVGLAQVNWKWHSKKFDSLWDALEPYKNLSVAAAHFRSQYDRPVCDDWVTAIGCYHRPAQGDLDKKIAKTYRHKVIKLWKKL